MSKNTTPNNRLTLTKDHAVIHTASIDVKVLRLDKRQMTLSVFRQLDEESIFLIDGSLRGTPWGRVNYVWPGNRYGTAFHIVWQDGDRIKRCPVPGPEWAGKAVVISASTYHEMNYPDWFWDSVALTPATVRAAFDSLVNHAKTLMNLDQLFIAT